jgi:DNA-binding transcriptional MerR regulator
MTEKSDVSTSAFPENQEIGYRGATACVAAGITYRQLDYWARTGLVEPGVQSAAGSGSQRLYGFRDILVLKIVKRLLDTGVSLQNIRTAVEHLRSRGISDLERMTLMSDGASIYECASADEIVDLLQGGQGVFGIAIGKVWSEVEGSLATLQGERVTTGETTVAGLTSSEIDSDELSERRKRKGA